MHHRVVLLVITLAAAHAWAAPNDPPPETPPAADPAPAPAPTPPPPPPPPAPEPPSKPTVTVFGRAQLLSQIDPQDNGDVPDLSVLPGGTLKKEWNASLQMNGVLGGRFVYPKPIGGFTASGQVVTVVFVRRIFTVPIMGFTLDNPEAGLKIGIGKFVQPTVSTLSPGAFQFSATWGNLLHATTGAYVAKTIDHVLVQVGAGRPDSDLFTDAITPTANATPPVPFVEGRVAYIDRRYMGEMPSGAVVGARPAPLMIGLSGAFGRQRVGINEKTFVQMISPGAVDPLVEDVPSWLVSAEFVVPIRQFVLAGEWYIGKGANAYIGAVRQKPHVDPMTGQHTALESRGGWVQLSYTLPMHVTALALLGFEHVTGGLDVGVPVDNPLKISENRLVAMSLSKTFDVGLHAGVQLQQQATHYIGLSAGEMVSVLLESSIDFWKTPPRGSCRVISRGAMFEVVRRSLDALTLPVVHGQGNPFDYLHGHKRELQAELDTHGALLLRGFAIENASTFQDVVRVFAPQLLNYEGGDSPRAAVTDKIYTSTSYPAALPISLHNEMSYTREFPGLIAFYCDVAPESGGETPIADCRRVLAAVPPRIVEQFEARRVRYVQNLHAGKGLGRSWRDTFETDDRERVEAILAKRHADFSWKPDGSLRVSEVIAPVIAHPRTKERVFFSQAHLWHVSSLDPKTRDALLKMVGEADLYHSCSYGDGTPIDPDDLAETRRAYESCAVALPWQKHDVLLVDNILVAHGRRPFKGDRRILVAMG